MSDRWLRSPGRGPLKLEDPARPVGARRRPAAFLDRDGVLNEAVYDPAAGAWESPLEVDAVRLLPGAALAAATLAGAGYALVCVSNQPAAAKGRISLEQLLSVHERVLELLALEGVRLDATRLCPHHPQGVVEDLAGPCVCRKPAPGMLLDAADTLDLDLGASWMLGDTDADVAAGRSAGCRTVLIAYSDSAHKRSPAARPDLGARNLADGVAQLLRSGSG